MLVSKHTQPMSEPSQAIMGCFTEDGADEGERDF